MFCRLKQISEMNYFCLKQVQCLKALATHLLPKLPIKGPSMSRCLLSFYKTKTFSASINF